MRKIILFLTLMLTLVSCGSEDDICTSGEATPRIKIKFKTAANNKILTLDSIYVSVDLGNGPRTIIRQNSPSDSIIIPLRVDDSPFTDIYVKLGPTRTDSAKIRINYTTTSQYVSPACGIKKSYENVNSVLQKNVPVVGLEQVQNQIINEQKTSLYFLF